MEHARHGFYTRPTGHYATLRRTSHFDVACQPDEVSSTALETDMLPGDVKLWSNGEVEESPEEMETPMPVAFGPVLAFMETSYDEARAEYFNMLKDHVEESLARIVDRTSKCGQK